MGIYEPSELDREVIPLLEEWYRGGRDRGYTVHKDSGSLEKHVTIRAGDKEFVGSSNFLGTLNWCAKDAIAKHRVWLETHEPTPTKAQLTIDGKTYEVELKEVNDRTGGCDGR